MGKVSRRLANGLILYVRYMAWLNATPKPPPGSKRAKAEEEEPRVSRLARMKLGKASPPMPPNPAQHIIDRLIEMGISEAAGMGVVALSWREINAWCDGTRIDLSPWERRLIRKLSVEYVAESRRAEDETCPSPWRAPVTKRERELEEERLRMVF
ncbi:MAG TPA: hypothetical protein VF503_20605 [Sphingobium sp.]|uniref:phage tail assembly chaperone n=1 Tax=Sphingobium sp. TaxID=1912891 RepID=UPI002ED1F4BF